MTTFDADVIARVTAHMNGDHTDDNLLIARAFGRPEATASRMTGVTADAGVWTVEDPAGEHELVVPWPAGAISERPEIRREVVALYRAACEKLGVPAREEHAPERPVGGQHGVHGGGHPHGAHGEAESHDGPKPFSAVIREASWGDHSDSEGAGFMHDIMTGAGTLQDYIDLVAQHFFMYEALEAAAEVMLADERTAALHPAALVRMPELEADLAFLIGDDWRDRIEPVPATAEYAARIREVAGTGSVPDVVAHHYTRYLGDLSGGQMIARRVAKQHGFEGAGVGFYDFSGLESIPDFKRDYRQGLDALGETLDAEAQQRMVDEVRRAYAFNTAVFEDLAKAKSEASAA